MKLSKLTLLLFFIFALSVAAANISFASKADQLIKTAQRAVVKAQAATNSTDRDENYKKAIDAYTTVTKQYANTIQAAEAQYGTAVIHETAKKGQYHNLRVAYDSYKTLINNYDKDPKVLSDNYEPGEIKRIQEIVAASKAQKQKLADELDKENSKKTLYKILDFIVNITGKNSAYSYWLAIIIVTLIVKILITPLTKAQFKAMKEMQKIAPLIKELQEKYKGDQKTIGEKTMDLYKEHHINPFASCLPMLIQMPILWLLYAMIRDYEFQFAKGTFLWIGSGLSHLSSIVLPFGSGGKLWVTARNLSEPDLILVLLYVVSMYISTKLSAVDPSQAEQQKMMSIVMPVMFAFIFASFPSAFLLYWLAFNVIQTVQQYLILRPNAATEPAVAPDEPEGGDSTRVRRRRRR